MTVDLTIEAGVATITMNRPQALNAFNTAQLERLRSVIQDVAANPAVRVAILTGAGERSFAAGADIKEMAGLSAAEGLAFGRRGHAVANALEAMPQPVIAAVNGFAFGGGCELALACDIRLASENARFAQPEVFEPGDHLRLACEWDNAAGDATVNWGDGTSDEMCLGIFYATAL